MDGHASLRVDHVIIGGGVAGLSAGLRLAASGAKTLLIEKGDYPAHRVCGEFLSPESLPLLTEFGISPPATIRRVSFAIGERTVRFNLPMPAKSMARFQLDACLANRFRELGGILYTQTGARDVHVPPKEDAPYFTRLSDGTLVESSSLIMGTGRLISSQQGRRAPRLVYAGLKAHVRGLSLDDCLELHVLKHGYAGISMVDDETANIALLGRWKGEAPSDPAPFLQGAPLLARRLETAELLFDKWLCVRAPEFGMRKNPPWPNAYFIGDAAGVIPPACGGGLSMALTSGVMAARYALEGEWRGFRKAWMRTYARRMRWGNLVHRMLLSPVLCAATQPLVRVWRGLLPYLWEHTRS